jgi:rRNA maturation protein Nop10
LVNGRPKPVMSMNRTKYLKGECSECGGHLEFPAESVGLTTTCPHCGKQTELLLATPLVEPTLPRRTVVWTVIALSVLILGLGGAMVALNRAQKAAARKKQPVPAELPATNAPPPAPEDPAAKAGFQVSAIALEKTAGRSLVYAVGSINNAADKQRFGLKLELDLFDAAGKKVGTAKDYLSVLEPKGEWKFKALVVEPKAASAKFASIREDQ